MHVWSHQAGDTAENNKRTPRDAKVGEMGKGRLVHLHPKQDSAHMSSVGLRHSTAGCGLYPGRLQGPPATRAYTHALRLLGWTHDAELELPAEGEAYPGNRRLGVPNRPRISSTRLASPNCFANMAAML